MEEYTSVQEPGYSDSPSPLSEPPDITNWFSSYVYESSPLCSLAKESENEVPDKENLDVAVPESKSPEIFVSNKDHNKPMNKRTRQISDRKQYESFPSEPPDLGNWFSSYIYESPMLDTSDGLELSVPGESECIKETTNVEGNNNVSSSKVTDLSQSQFVLSEPPDVRNWFSSYEYQSPELSETHEVEFSYCEKDQLIIDESDTEEEHSSGKTKSKQETISPDKENIAAKEKEKNSSVGLFGVLTKEEKQEPSFKQEPLFCESIQEPSFGLGVSETGFVTMKKARFEEASDRCSTKKPNRGLLVECSRSKKFKKMSREVDEEEEEKRRKKRRVVGEMLNQQFSGTEEIAGKWHCPQKNKGNIAPPLKQLRLDAWIHKIV